MAEGCPQRRSARRSRRTGPRTRPRNAGACLDRRAILLSLLLWRQFRLRLGEVEHRVRVGLAKASAARRRRTGRILTPLIFGTLTPRHSTWVRRLHRPQQAGDGPRGAPIPFGFTSPSRPGAPQDLRRTPMLKGPTYGRSTDSQGWLRRRWTSRRRMTSPRASAAETADKYVHDRLPRQRALYRRYQRGFHYAACATLVGLGGLMLVFSVVLLTQLRAAHLIARGWHRRSSRFGRKQHCCFAGIECRRPTRFQLSCSASPMMMPSGPRTKQSR
jgi:hypothetical protein